MSEKSHQNLPAAFRRVRIGLLLAKVASIVLIYALIQIVIHSFPSGMHAEISMLAWLFGILVLLGLQPLLSFLLYRCPHCRKDPTASWSEDFSEIDQFGRDAQGCGAFIALLGVGSFFQVPSNCGKCQAPLTLEGLEEAQSSSKGGQMATIDSLSFDLTDCEPQEQGELSRGWINARGVCHLLRFGPENIGWPFDLTQPERASDFFRQQCDEKGGVMLSMAVKRAHGFEVLEGIFKYRSPVENSMGKYYVGILWLPFEHCTFQINVEDMERGTTGMREAAVMLLEKDKLPEPDEETPPVRVNSIEEMFGHMRAAPVRLTPADHERYDEKFPNHPLSLVRSRLAEVLASLRFDETSKEALKPYRVPRP